MHFSSSESWEERREHKSICYFKQYPLETIQLQLQYRKTFIKVMPSDLIGFCTFDLTSLFFSSCFILLMSVPLATPILYARYSKMACKLTRHRFISMTTFRGGNRTHPSPPHTCVHTYTNHLNAAMNNLHFLSSWRDFDNVSGY